MEQNQQRLKRTMSVLFGLLLLGLMGYIAWNIFHKDPVASLPEIKPDAYASSIFFTVNTDKDEMKVTSATVVMLSDKDVPKWKRQKFYVNPKASTVRFENGAYVFSLKKLDCTETLHGSIAEKAVALMDSDSAGVQLCFQAHDVRLWDQIEHQSVRATFDTCRVHVGNVAHTHTRDF